MDISVNISINISSLVRPVGEYKGLTDNDGFEISDNNDNLIQVL